ncbi:MAG: ABC transporter ATP-binding protein [Rhodospirillaceae bacterium]|nr:ABC transporter ATP-binding protein [Rhodospirillaceae bacterium]MBL6931585.1 ABC transporter ATP-binding protein [Rhodospirillales bacterium]
MSNIRVQNLTKRFGDLTAVSGVDLEIKAGEVLCLLGPSGCGKTTTLRMIAGLEQVSDGDVYIADEKMNGKTPSQRDVAMVFQFYALYPTLTVAENMAFPLRAEKKSEAEINSRVQEVARALALTEVMERLPDQLGEGEKQRVAVARAVVRDPNCFLFDEPLSRLDVTLRQTMRGEIKEILNGLSKATVIVTHDQLEALTMADRIAVMRDGYIEQVATPHDIFTRPANLFVAGFIGTPSMNLLEATLTKFQDGKASIDLDSQKILIDVDKAVEGIDAGSQVTLGIRPRAFQVVDAAGEDTISATVDLIEPMGAETLLHMMDGETEMRVVVGREMKVHTGETLHLQCKPSQALIFDGNGQLVLT